MNVAFSQEIRVHCKDEPLNRVLINLRDSYGLMVSFDDSHLSTFLVSRDQVYSSPVKAVEDLIKGLPLGCEVNRGVITIFTVKTKEKPIQYLLSGTVSDATSHESLPYSTVLINQKGLFADARGHFSYISATDSIFSVRVSSLGYYIKDTVLAGTGHIDFLLTPSVIALKEIIIQGSQVERTIQTGISPGVIRLNHKIAYYLPGSGDNSIFNLLRLQPGILAAGEQSGDLMIWGSYEGQSQVIFDGFTLYGLKNFNDNISSINPYMAKDIKLMKGIFGAEYGERVGGIADITGTDGNRLSPSFQFCLNNMTLNGFASVPLQKKSTIMLAYRKTYYNLYNPVEYNPSGSGRGRMSGMANYYLIPDYDFNDLNFKYSGSGDNSNYFLSLYRGRDRFSYSYDQSGQWVNIALNYDEENTQLGASVFYGYRWKDKHTSNFTLSFSSLLTERERNVEIERMYGGHLVSNLQEQYKASINEVNGRVENKIVISERNTADMGGGLIHYYTNKISDTFRDSLTSRQSNLQIPFLYFQNNISVNRNLTLKPGLRIDYHSLSAKAFFQPRVSVMYRIHPYVSLNMAAGIYHQFVAKNMIIDSTGNYNLVWSICDDNKIPVLNARGITAGITFSKNKFTASAEGYFKYTEGITRYVRTGQGIIRYEGQGNTKGMDIFIKKEFRNQTVWISYTLSKSEESFPYFPTDEYVTAMHDQRHEIKLTGMAKFRSFHLSANYVFGSGLPDPANLPETVSYSAPYSRLDAAVTYNYSKGKFQLDAGISVLNVLNRENIKYSNYIRIPANENTTVSFYAESVPFMPALFLKIYYGA